jgi:outer membrane protein OmpA-like peptidoglycan-associated protein
VGINPAENLMSVTSFGEYKPVQRSEDDSSYSLERLQADNSTAELKGRNRRVEVLLFYRF